MANPIDLQGIKNITISGRIGSGATTLAKSLSDKLGWDLLEGGELFEKIMADLNLDQSLVESRPDHFDLEYEEKIKHMLRDEDHHIIQSHLAGYDAQGIDGVYKILVICEENGEDKRDIRIDRLVNRDGKSVEDAKNEVLEREKEHLAKFRRLYADNDPDWVYWQPKYYNLVINTFDHNKKDAYEAAIRGLGIK